MPTHEPDMNNIVSHPQHYTQGPIECWDFLISHNPDFLRGNIVKYLVRFQWKNGLEDLQKAKAYLEKYASTCQVHTACQRVGIDPWEYGLGLNLPVEACLAIDLLLRGGSLAIAQTMVDRLIEDNTPTEEAPENTDEPSGSSEGSSEDPPQNTPENP